MAETIALVEAIAGMMFLITPYAVKGRGRRGNGGRQWRGGLRARAE